MTVAAPALRPYQQQALDAIWGAYQKGTNRILIQAATGTGKTTVFASLLRHPPVAQWLAQFGARDRRVLIIAHREELIQQAAERIRRLNPDLYVGIEQAGMSAGPFADVTVASIQTLSAVKYRRLERLLRHGPFRIVVIDEAHHASAASYRNCLIRLGFLPPEEGGEDDEVDAAKLATILREWDATAPRDRLLLGVTATPNRSDAVGLGCVFQTIAHAYGIKDAIDDGWLVSPVPWVVESGTGLDEVAIRRGEFDQRQLSKTVNTPQRNAIAVRAWAQYAKDRPTIVFGVDVQHAKDLAETFLQQGVYARMVSGETPKDERQQVVRDFLANKVPVLTNCAVYTEGVDLPLASCVLMAKPTKSATLYAQCVGRVLRPHPGKADAVIIDVVDVSRRHSLLTAPVLYGLPPVKPEGKTLKQISEELEALQAEYPNFSVQDALALGALTLEQLRARAKTFDIWAVPALGAEGEGLSLEWIKAGEGMYRIQYPWNGGTEVMKVEKDMLGHYEISCTYRPLDAMLGRTVRQSTLAAQLPDAATALRAAETYIATQRHDVVRLKDKGAKWKQRPASEKQIALLMRRRIPIKPGLTMGEASAAIDLANARRGW